MAGRDRTGPEQAVYHAIKRDAWAQNVCLVQERLAWDVAWRAVQRVGLSACWSRQSVAIKRFLTTALLTALPPASVSHAGQHHGFIAQLFQGLEHRRTSQTQDRQCWAAWVTALLRVDQVKY
ncbi:MAG: hypothetical protein KDI16_08195 [Halioglobus sp.]|nr:hypothetical protein [Halioglobus sp.]